MKVNKNKKGFSLLEIILVLAVAAGFIIGVFMLLSKSQASSNVKREAGNISTIRAGISALYASTANVSNPNLNQVAINADIIPNEMLTENAGEILSAWRGPVYIGTNSVDGKNGFVIRYETLTREMCVKLLTSVGSGFDEIKVAASNPGMSGIPSGGVIIKSSSVTFTPSAASTACRMYESATGNQIMFGFR